MPKHGPIFALDPVMAAGSPALENVGGTSTQEHAGSRGSPERRSRRASTSTIDSNAEISAEHAAGSAVGIVVHADAVEAVIILLGTRAGDGQLRQTRGFLARHW